MRSGLLRERLTYQTKPAAASATYDAHGQETEDWTTQATYWGSVRAATGREREVANQLGNEVSHVVETRYFGRVDPKVSRFLLGSRVLRIVGAVDVDDRGATTRYQVMETV